MRWNLRACNIVDEPADVLICSANPHLTLSGGVGADLLARFGTKMQLGLSRIVAARSPHFVQQGEVIAYSDDSLPYRAVLHAVAVDGWYDSSPQIVEKTTRRALELAASQGATKVALTALATGFGKLTLGEFAEGIRPLLLEKFPPCQEIIICVLEDHRAQELSEHLGLPLSEPLHLGV